jgi:flagellin FlaB
VEKMGKLFIKLKKKELGAIGIGAMIVFIAMVLVAGIAASVLIQTSSKLEHQAMISGQETIAEVSTGIAVTQIEGYNATGANSISELAVHVRPRAGSSDIDLAETVLEISDSSTKNLFVYDSVGFADTDAINGDLFALTAFDGGGTDFRIVVLEDADDSVSSTNPVINKGDHVVLCVSVDTAFGGLSPRTDIFGQVIPEEGSPGVISFTTPPSYNDAILELQ